MKYLIAVAWILLIGILGYLPQQRDFLIIFACYTALFGLYIITYRFYRSHQDVLLFIFLSLFLRAILLFSFPNLSDDIYRFLWDGHLINDGINPYLYVPSEWIAQYNLAKDEYDILYPLLNSPNYFSIYPPVSQLFFTLCVKVFPDSLYWSSVLMKSFFLVAETLTIYFLMKLVQLMRLPQNRVLLYALNPLVIVELSGNLHFEAIMILFLVLALWSFIRKRFMLLGLFFGLSVGAKLLPLMFLPFFLGRMRFRQLLTSGTILITTLVIMFLPFLSQDLISNFSESLNLYFQKFEFNGSTYYLMRWVGFKKYGYNLIQTYGPILSVFTMLLIVGLAWFEKSKRLGSLLKSCLFAFTIYLLLSTTVHPWYLAIPVLLSVFTFYRYPIFWSGLITLTYINYAYTPYHENLWIVAFEYGLIVPILIVELYEIPIARIFMTLAKFFSSVFGFK